MSSLLFVVVVHNEGVYQVAHSSTHPQGAEHKRPHNLVQKVARASHAENTGGEGNGFDEKIAEPEEEEWTDVRRCLVVVWRSGD